VSLSNFSFLKIEWPDLHDAAQPLAELNALFAALQYRAFCGKL
jgi:hypothetical protein